MRPALSALTALARDAGALILAARAEGVAVVIKSDGSPVTAADQRAEALIAQGLAQLAPDIPMIGEESVAAGRLPECGARYFLVDPLDGTRDFVAGGPEFTVNIALVENGAPTLGVVYAPATDDLYAAEPGDAQHNGAPIHTARHTPWRVITSRHSGQNQATADFLARLGAHERVSVSSSIKLCRLAEGAADLYPRFGDVHAWDIAAGHAVLAAAGGGAIYLDGAPLIYDSKQLLAPGFIAYASDAAATAARAALTY